MVGAAVRLPLVDECWYGTDVCGGRVVHALVVNSGE